MQCVNSTRRGRMEHGGKVRRCVYPGTSRYLARVPTWTSRSNHTTLVGQTYGKTCLYRKYTSLTTPFNVALSQREHLLTGEQADPLRSVPSLFFFFKRFQLQQVPLYLHKQSHESSIKVSVLISLFAERTASWSCFYFFSLTVSLPFLPLCLSSV